MATISSSIRLTDNMTPIFKNMINGMNSMVDGFEKMERTSGSAINSKAMSANLAIVRSEFNKADATIKTFEESIKKTNSVTGDFDKSMDRSTGTVSNWAKGLSFAAGGAALALGSVLVGGIVDGIKGMAEMEEQTAQMNAVLESTGGASGMAGDALITMADAIEDTTKFTAEQAMAGENMLLTFTNIGKDVFPEATSALMDMAQAMGGDPVSSAVQLGKALNDPVEGMSALSRVGIVFTEEQKKTVLAMQESGDMAGAQSVILAELTKEFGGSAEAAGKTFAGKLVILKNKLGEATEGLVTGIMPAVTGFTDLVIAKMPDIQAFCEDVGDAFNLLVAGFNGTGDASTLDGWDKKFYDLGETVKTTRTTIDTAMTGIKAGVTTFGVDYGIEIDKMKGKTAELEAQWTTFYNRVKPKEEPQAEGEPPKDPMFVSFGTGMAQSVGEFQEFAAIILAGVNGIMSAWDGLAAGWDGLATAWDSICKDMNETSEAQRIAFIKFTRGVGGAFEAMGIAVQNVFIDMHNGAATILNNFGQDIPIKARIGADGVPVAISSAVPTTRTASQQLYAGAIDPLKPLATEMPILATGATNAFGSSVGAQSGWVGINAQTVHDATHGAIAPLTDELGTIGAGSVKSMGGGIDVSAPIVDKASVGIYKLITGQLNPLGQFGTDTGGFLASGLTKGMGTWNAFTTATQGVVDFVKNAFLKGFDINSPAGFTIYVGEMLGQGLINSLSNTNLGKVATSLMGTLKEAFLQGRTNALSIFEHMGDMGSALLARMGISLPTLGNMLFPTDNTDITSYFGNRDDPMNPGSTRFHSGIDIGAAYGDAVKATAPGTVIFAGENGGYGNMVEIDHGNGITTLYAHLSKILTSVGENVAAGKKIGEVGSTGDSTGAHLHYGVYQNGEAVDPLSTNVSSAGGDVGAWIQQAMKTVGISGQDNFNHLMTIAMNESGGDPNAINNWDSNAMAGTPSKGLMQTIQSTFDAYSMGGSIWDPVANAVAAIRYMIDAYGSVLNTGTHGYANGTRNATRGLHLVGENGPELLNFRGGETVTTNKDTVKALTPEKAAALRNSAGRSSRGGKTSLAPIINISMGGVHVNEELDIKKVVRLLGDELEEQLQISAAGIY